MLRPHPDAAELVASERAALVAARILDGAPGGPPLTTRQIAEYVGLSWDGAYKLMLKLSRILPIANDGNGWRRTS